MRIHKLLSEAGVVSRRGAEKLIEQGRVEVNGRKAKLGQDVDSARDIIHIDGERVVIPKKQPKYYIALNKPRGYVTTLSDEFDRKCITDLMSDFPSRVYPVGRLDKDSEGLLILTNDGNFANYIMHPKNHIPKTYRVTVKPIVTEEQLVKLMAGVTLDDGYVTAPATVLVETKEPTRVVLRFTITEGKNRQVRRMCDAVGLNVIRLKRVSIGPIKLGMIQPGKWRELSAFEAGAMRNAVITTPEAPNPNRKKRSYRFIDKKNKKN